MSVTFSVYFKATGMFDGPEVNMANGNAAYMAGLLGIERDEDGCLFGEMDAEDFLGRVVLARGLSVGDPGVPQTETRGERGALFIDCGRHEGYADQRLIDLEEVAHYAVDHAATVAWG